MIANPSSTLVLHPNLACDQPTVYYTENVSLLILWSTVGHGSHAGFLSASTATATVVESGRVAPYASLQSSDA